MIDLSIPGQMTRGELEGLETLAKTVPADGVVVETGSLYGLSSYVWATSIPQSATLYCIDPWVREQWIIDLVETKVADCPEFCFEAFQHYTRSCNNLVPVKGYSPQDVADWHKPVDIFFDDSMHHNPYFQTNLRFWLKKMKPGGVMCGHDYSELWPDVPMEVDKLAAELGVKVETREALWWLQLPAERSWLGHIRKWFS